MAGDDILVARKSFVARAGDGRRIRFKAGKTRVRASDPIVKGREQLFAPVGDNVIETATAAPGERRNTRRAKSDDSKPPAKKAAKKPAKKAAKKATQDES